MDLKDKDKIISDMASIIKEAQLMLDLKSAITKVIKANKARYGHYTNSEANSFVEKEHDRAYDELASILYELGMELDGKKISIEGYTDYNGE